MVKVLVFKLIFNYEDFTKVTNIASEVACFVRFVACFIPSKRKRCETMRSSFAKLCIMTKVAHFNYQFMVSPQNGRTTFEIFFTNRNHDKV